LPTSNGGTQSSLNTILRHVGMAGGVVMKACQLTLLDCISIFSMNFSLIEGCLLLDPTRRRCSSGHDFLSNLQFLSSFQHLFFSSSITNAMTCTVGPLRQESVVKAGLNPNFASPWQCVCNRLLKFSVVQFFPLIDLLFTRYDACVQRFFLVGFPRSSSIVGNPRF